MLPAASSWRVAAPTESTMQTFRLDILRFRGIGSLTVRPRGHVLLVGEPRSGRSTVFEALRRVLSPDSTRFPLGGDLDFYEWDTSEPISIEVVLGELGPALEQDFFDHLEVGDRETGEVVTEAPDPASVGEDTELVLRLSTTPEN
jgi:energy-coupling factor transporter ATP-binding protein EcfA2